MIESNSRSFILSPWLADLHETATELGYFLHVEQAGTKYRAICGDLEDLETTLLQPDEQQPLTNQMLAHMHRRLGRADTPERAALGAFMLWHTQKIERDFRRSF